MQYINMTLKSAAHIFSIDPEFNLRLDDDNTQIHDMQK